MNYEQTVEWLFTQLPMFQRVGASAYKADLHTTLQLDEYFCHPHKHYKTIHIAGTNGKGSTSHMLASVLQAAGYKTGLYTSPHLIDFRERIKINGKMIEKEAVVEFVEQHAAYFSNLNPSFFEITAAMAFWYFEQQKVDIAVIETGMGGRLDSTNIVQPLVSVITNISLDHTQFLGETLGKIAGEKAGIIKPATPIIIGESNVETKPVFEAKAQLENAPLFFAEEKFCTEFSTLTADQSKQIIRVKNAETQEIEAYTIDLTGIYQEKNICTVIQTLDVLKDLIEIPKQAVLFGLENAAQNTGLQGRWQILSANPRIICDTGHNEAGIANIVTQLNKLAYKELHIVLGAVADKNIGSMLKQLPKHARYYFTKANLPRALAAEKLHSEAQIFGLKGEIFQTVPEAFLAAQRNANEHDTVFVGGSTFVVADLLMFLEQKII